MAAEYEKFDLPLGDEMTYGVEDYDVTEIEPPSDFIEDAVIEGSEEDSEDGEPEYDMQAATDAFLKFIREAYNDDYTADSENREAALEDMKFLAGDQWPDKIKRKRVNKNKPVLTLNRLPAFIGLVVNQRRQNEASIHVLPDESGDKQVAQVRQGLIRSIEKMSNAKYAYNTAHLNQVACGDGAFELCLEYADDDVFEQVARIKALPNAMSVLWDRMSTDPTGKDAGHCFVEDYLTTREFKDQYPDAKVTDFVGDPIMASEARGEGWYVNDTVRVVNFWRMRAEMRTLALLVEIDPETQQPTGTRVEDVTDMDPAEWQQLVLTNPDTGQPYVRRSRVRYAESYVTNGIELLDGPYRMPVPRVPVFRAVGWEIYVGQRVQRFGLVRFLKDPQRMHNYWRSVVVEKLMQTPRPKWIAPTTAVEGREKSFRDSASSDDPLLVYNGEAGVAPQLMPPAQLEEALINEAGMAAQDIRDISNLHEASLGMAGNEVSGKAITARQEIGETGVAIYQDNLNMAIEECGRCLNRLIPYIYDTPRKVRVLGSDDKEQIEAINGMDGGMDITEGRYDVTVTTGPSFATKRRQASESMLNMVNAMPETLAVAADKIIEAQDWPGSEEIAKRLRANLPPNMVDTSDLTDEELEARQQAQQQAQEQAQLAQADAEADIAMKQAQAQDYQARAADAAARAAKTYADIDFERVRLMEETEKKQFDMLLDGARFYAELNDQGDENYGE